MSAEANFAWVCGCGEYFVKGSQCPGCGVFGGSRKSVARSADFLPRTPSQTLLDLAADLSDLIVDMQGRPTSIANLQAMRAVKQCVGTLNDAARDIYCTEGQ